MNITISIPKKYHKILQEEKRKTGLAMSEIVRRALDRFVMETPDSIEVSPVIQEDKF